MKLGYPMIICSCSTFETLKHKYPKRNVMQDRNCPDWEWFYWNQKGRMRTVEKDNSIWEAIYEYCDLLGIEAPTGMIQRIR